MIKHPLLLSVIIYCSIKLITAKPQEISSDDTIQNNINLAFTTPRSVGTSNRGFNQIVTAEPIIGPTTARKIPKTDTCKCVPYYMCDAYAKTIIEPAGDEPQFQIDIRFDAQECAGAVDICCMTTQQDDPTVEPVVQQPLSAKPDRPTGCGIRNIGGIDFKLVGATNNEAGYGEFPWTVALIRISDDACTCVGSLIHPKAVLTGAHCVKDFKDDVKNLKIRAGEWDTQTKNERLPYQERIVSRIFSHPDFNPRSLANDFAVIELEDPFQLDDHINTICLPPAGFESSSKNCFATGWGKDRFGKDGVFSVIMKRVPLPIVPFNQCQTALQQTRLTTAFTLDQSFICAGGEKGIDTCQGDGGAPLVCPTGPPADNRYQQSGIVSWGIGCHESNPGVYASVAKARLWIDSQIGYVGLDKNYYTYEDQ